MNLRAPYSPPLPARKAPPKRAAHFRHDHTHPQIHRNHRLVVAGGGVVIDGNDGGADPVARELRVAAGNLLCRGWYWMGVAGDADHQLDGAAGRLALAYIGLCLTLSVTSPIVGRGSAPPLPKCEATAHAEKLCPKESRAWRAANAVARPRRCAEAHEDWFGLQLPRRPISPTPHWRSRLPPPSRHAAGARTRDRRTDRRNV